MKSPLFLFTLVSLISAPSQAQSGKPDWLTSLFVGSLWRTERPVPMGDTSYVEPALRPLLPPAALEDLRFSRPPEGAIIANRLMHAADLRTVPDPLSRTVRTDSLLAMVTGDENQEIDAAAYLRMRLFDHLIGDWSRAPEDIRWLAKEEDGRILWIPFPVRYKNAFARYNGILPWILLQISEQMTSWSHDPLSSLKNSSPLEGLDRRILSPVPWSEWDSIAAVLMNSLPEETINAACGVFPGPDGKKLREALQRRVIQLPVLAQQYFRDITRYVEFSPGGPADSIFIKVRSKRAIEVSLDGTAGSSRLLNSLATREVRFLLMNGNHSLWLEGPDVFAFDIIVDLGDGPSSIWHRRNSLEQWTAGAPGGIEVFHTPPAHQSGNQEDAWGERISFVPWVDANKDDHIFIGGGPEITTSAYRAIPFATRTTILAGFATRTKRFRLRGSFETRALVRGFRLGLEAEYSQLNISNFFGIGNETSAPEALLSRSSFKADQRTVDFSARARVVVSDFFSVGLSPTLRLLRTDPRQGSLIDSLISSGYPRRLNYTRLGLDLLYDSRDRSAIPTHGMYAYGNVTWSPPILQNKTSFASFRIESRYYHFIGPEGMHLLLRTSGVAVAGDHPWFESAFIGGSQTLRGYERQRFAGDAAVSTALELRLPTGRIHALWPFDTGALAFVETGRVFVKHEASRRWHSSVGVGAWFHPARSPYTFVISVAGSKELTEFLATFGLPIQ